MDICLFFPNLYTRNISFMFSVWSCSFLFFSLEYSCLPLFFFLRIYVWSLTVSWVVLVIVLCVVLVCFPSHVSVLPGPSVACLCGLSCLFLFFLCLCQVRLSQSALVSCFSLTVSCHVCFIFSFASPVVTQTLTCVLFSPAVFHLSNCLMCIFKSLISFCSTSFRHHIPSCCARSSLSVFQSVLSS